MTPRPLTRRVVVIAFAALIVLLAIGYIGVSYEIASGVTKADRLPFEETPAAYHLVYQDVTFPSRQVGVSLSGWYIPYVDSRGVTDPARPSLILVHGLDSERAADGWVGLADRMDQLGYNVLMFDLRGEGTSGPGRVSGGYFEQYDVLGAFDYLLSKGTPSDKIGIMGRSMGAAITIMAAADDPRIRAIVADSTFAVASDLVAQEVARKTPIKKPLVPIFLPLAKLMARTFYGINIDAVVPENSVRELDYPIYQIHDETDPRVPLSEGQLVAAAAPPGSVFWVVPVTGHVEAFKDDPDEYVQRVYGYFAQRLGAPSLVTTGPPIPVAAIP